LDKIVSVGRVEHLGEKNLDDYFSPGISPATTGRNVSDLPAGTRAVDSTPTFTDLYIFPDGELVPIFEWLEYAERSGFEIRDIQNRREHDRLTLLHWWWRLEAQEPAAKEGLVGELECECGLYISPDRLITCRSPALISSIRCSSEPGCASTVGRRAEPEASRHSGYALHRFAK
jgi:hypothetical protein